MAVLSVSSALAETLIVTWDQNPEPNITAYRVFLGTSSGSYSETFDIPGDQTSFVYANAVRGRRYFVAVAAQADGTVWGPRSTEASGTAATSAVPDQPARLSTSKAGAVDAASVAVVASGLEPVGALAVSDAGMGLFVEGGHTVRLFDTTGLQAEPALALDEDVQIRDIALDPSFDRTGRAFLAASRTRRDGGREVTVERHRLLGGGLGESAAVVPGLRDDPAARTMLAVARDGRVIVAQSGAVLAFTADGHVPEAQAPARLGDGPVNPLSVVWDEAGKAVWLTGLNSAGASIVERLGVGGTSKDVMALPEVLADAVPVAHALATGHVSVAGASAEAVTEFDPTSAAARQVPVDLSRFGRAVLMVPGAGAWYVVLRQTSVTGATSDTVVRVAPGPETPQPILR